MARHEQLAVGELTVDQILVGEEKTDFAEAVTDTFAEVFLAANITVDAASAGSQTVHVQVKNDNDENIDYPLCTQVFLSDASTGLGFAASGADSISAGTCGAVLETVAGKAALVQTDADGKVDITVAESTAGADFYLVFVLPNGKQKVSTQLIPTPAT